MMAKTSTRKSRLFWNIPAAQVFNNIRIKIRIFANILALKAYNSVDDFTAENAEKRRGKKREEI